MLPRRTLAAGLLAALPAGALASVPADEAMLVGSYRLIRPQHAQQGINTRLFRKVGGRWVISMNHVSAYDLDPSAG